jgi:serine/threonine-protein kinase
MAKKPEQIGKYAVIDEIAQGGMGSVYTATHPTLDRTVIIKKLTLRGKADIRERFRREAQIMMDLRNDAIVNVYDHFREGASYYIVLEYVEGLSLDALIKKRRYIPNHIALLIFREVCQALDYAHARNVVHRDIKPANVLLSGRGDAKLADFGIATIHGESESELTREGMTLGTPSYMAPEQFHDTRSVDHRADIYSMGVMLYEMVTGKRPYPGSFTPEVLNRIQKGNYQSPRNINPKVWPFTQKLIRRMLRPKAKRRIGSLSRVVRLIDRRLRVRSESAARTAIAEYVNGDELVGVEQRRSRGWIAVAAAVVLLAGAIGFGTSRGYHRELFTPSQVGALEVLVRVEPGSKEADQLFLTGQLFLDDGTDIPAVEGGELRFSQVPSSEGDRFLTFRSRRVHAAPGAYRVKIEAESLLWWESVDLRPVRELVDTPVVLPGTRGTAQELQVDLVGQPSLPVAIDWIVRDATTQREIPSGVRVYVRIDGSRLLWSGATARRIRSGGVYTFEFSHPAYRPEVFVLLIKPFQSQLLLDVSLEPR